MNKQKILIVDDDRDIRTALNARLRANGYDTSFAGDGISALATARKESPDLILLDIGLSAGDGFVFLERVKDLPDVAGIPVIVITARDAAGNREKALAGGAVAFFQKPVDDAELLSAIWRALAAGDSDHTPTNYGV